MTFPDWLYTLTRYARQHPLGYRMMVYISACSFIFILCSTALQLSLDYGRELRVIDQQVELINRSYLASLAKSLWDLDQAQVELQLLGIQTLPDVIHVQLLNTQTGSILELPTPPPVDNRQLSVHQFELIHITSSQQARNLGQLQVSFDLHAVVQRVWHTGLSSLLNQALLVVLIVAVILVIVQRQITRHLESMATYSREIAAGQFDSRLQLDRTKPEQPDELDQLALALNDMRQAIRQDRDQLQLMVEHRTASLRRARDAAEDANRAKSQFLSTMSHEIRTPMNGMLGMIQLLEDSPLNAKQHKQLQVLHNATDGLIDTFDHVLQYGRLEEGGWVISRQRFSLKSLLHNLITLMTPGAEQKQLQLKLDLPEALAEHYNGAEGSLRQILTNLLNNAIKFTDQGQISLRCQLLEQHPSQHQLRFEVRDSGIGIAPALQQHIFERFAQADDSITRRFGGTGLGLAICHQLAQALEGVIGVESTPGQGSRFWLEIPLATESALPQASTTHNKAPQPPLDILLVEDVAINQQVILGLLAGEAHHISIANTGPEALQHSQQQRFDIILMDMHLPGLSGLEVSQHIRADSSNPNQHSTILALTASVRDEDHQRYTDTGLQGVIAKPVRKPELLAALYNHSTSLPVPIGEPLLDKHSLDSHRQALGDNKVQTLLDNLAQLLKDEWPTAQKAIDNEDITQIIEQAHKLAGACEMMGFLQTGQQLRTLEQQAGSVDTRQRAALDGAITQVIQHIQQHRL